MSEKQMTLAYTLDDRVVTLTIVRATTRIGVARYLLAGEGNRVNETETDEALKILRLIIYPNCISCTTSVEGMDWPITFDQFVDLPEDFVDKWLEAVYTMNPHWQGPEVAEKNAPSSSKRNKN